MIAHATLILNVDDNDGARYAKTRILQSAGFRVVEAENGTDALAFARRDEPDLVLLDVKLPDINGIEVCRRIKADPATAAILVLQTSAALTGRDDKIRGLEGGADNYLAAPIEADELIANVNALMRMRQTQSALRDSEERFRQLTDNIEDVFWMFAVPSGALVFVSPAYASIFGRLAGELGSTHDDWLAAVHPDDRAGVQRRWKATDEYHSYDEEFRVVTEDGTIRWVRDRLFPVRNARDEVYRVARVTSDITRRREMESLLRAADVNKNEFLATLAHELRNPLSPIRSAAALLANGGDDNIGLRERARDVITRQVDHLAHLVDDLLDVARISQGKIVLRREDINIGPVIAQAIETATPLLQARRHTLDVQLPAVDIWVSGDAVRLAQSVGNLLHNAAKFTPEQGKVSIRVELVGEVGAQVARIDVIDNGIGIERGNLSRIFGMFAQVSVAPDRAQEGLGIGLSLVSRLLEMHGGRLLATSPGIGLGSKFTVELPVIRSGMAPMVSVVVPHVAPPAEPARLRVLLVDDNVDAMEMMGFLLTEMGYDTLTASDAHSIVATALAERPDVIVLDIGLPGIDGYQLARLIKGHADLAHTRLVAHTGYGSPEDRQKARDAGFDAHLVKPAQLAALEAALRGE
ncbi:ATP-binding response regulator [Massilia sp. S19_KUP03_FR1]|uniref:ATP-binding response regulator n=1 Tax=Massilia sp. S19_KUP03_FR1 TaxID=3025503 RepID=UPI002FCDDF29